MFPLKDLHKLLREQWRRDQRDPWTDKEVLIVITATQISDEIRTMCVDKTIYPPFNNDEVDKLVPPLLLRLLQSLVSSKSKDQKVISRRITTIAHSIISAARMLSFISPLLLAIISYTHQLTASRQIIDVLSCLGISESYGELRRLQNALASQGIPSYADFQIATLTGHGTFHSLGGLMVCTPPVSSDPKTLKRSVEIPKANDSRASCSLDVQSYTKTNKIGLSSINVEALELKFALSFRLHSDVANKAMMLDFVWLTSFGRVLAPPITSWSGFMQVVIRGKYHDTSSVHTIPFVHATPSDMSTLQHFFLLKSSVKSIMHHGSNHF